MEACDLTRRYMLEDDKSLIPAPSDIGMKVFNLRISRPKQLCPAHVAYIRSEEG